MRVIDLTMPMRPHWRWNVSLETLRTIGPGEPFHISQLQSNVHAFSHVDSPMHVVAGATSLDRIPLERVAGPAAVIDLSDKGPHEAITAEDLEQRGRHLQKGDIVLLRTSWDKKYSFESKDYWTQACYVSDEAADWLYDRAPSAVGYDFPQDRPLRFPYGHGSKEASSLKFEEFTTHARLLTRGILNIEYLMNLHRIETPRPYVFALPLLIEGAEAAPARVIAVEF